MGVWCILIARRKAQDVRNTIAHLLEQFRRFMAIKFINSNQQCGCREKCRRQPLSTTPWR